MNAPEAQGAGWRGFLIPHDGRPSTVTPTGVIEREQGPLRRGRKPGVGGGRCGEQGVFR